MGARAVGRIMGSPRARGNQIQPSTSNRSRLSTGSRRWDTCTRRGPPRLGSDWPASGFGPELQDRGSYPPPRRWSSPLIVRSVSTVPFPAREASSARRLQVVGLEHAPIDTLERVMGGIPMAMSTYPAQIVVSGDGFLLTRPSGSRMASTRAPVRSRRSACRILAPRSQTLGHYDLFEAELQPTVIHDDVQEVRDMRLQVKGATRTSAG